MSNGFIYKSTYEGWYCTSDEAFVSESLVVLNDNNIKVSSESGNAVEWSTEENYIFKLTHFKQQLLDWINSGDVIKPSGFADILRHDIQKGVRDLSVSRPKSRLNWGIAVPNDESQTVHKPIVF
jgi:methionyl-tRNA synthetase